MEIEFDEEIFNPVYIPTYNFKGRILLLYGSAGSGKSEWAASKLLIRTLKETPHRFLFVRKVAKTIRDSQFRLFKDIISRWNLSECFTFKESEMDIICRLNGNALLSAGLDDVEKLKSITGITGIWAEEATELENDDFKQLNLRLRGITKNYKQFILSFNPIDDEHWIYNKPGWFKPRADK